MSFKTLVIIFISSFLIFASVPPAMAQVKDGPITNTDLGVGPTAFDLEDVRQVQMMLKNRGYDPGEVNGMMTSQTQEALRQFQTANNLPVTGKIDQQTQVALGVTVKGTEHNQAITEQARQKPTERPTQTQPQRFDTSKTEKVDKDAQERIEKSAMVLQELTRAEDNRIPNELLERAEAIAVIPNMVKAAFGIGGRYGKGVVSRRQANGSWGSPAFLQIGGGSFGLQLGGSSTDLVLVFTDAKALDLLERGKDLKLGVDAGVVAGPIGRSAEAGVNANLASAIYAYSRAKGLFAGVALDGAVLDLDDSMNKKVYGQSVMAKDVLSGRGQMMSVTRPFTDALERIVPKKRITQR
jgi:SH3 domain-containing YSC84-like protein 1